jgi:hypothetical protein
VWQILLDFIYTLLFFFWRTKRTVRVTYTVFGGSHLHWSGVTYRLRGHNYADRDHSAKAVETFPRNQKCQRKQRNLQGVTNVTILYLTAYFLFWRTKRTVRVTYRLFGGQKSRLFLVTYRLIGITQQRQPRQPRQPRQARQATVVVTFPRNRNVKETKGIYKVWQMLLDFI